MNTDSVQVEQHVEPVTDLSLAAFLLIRGVAFAGTGDGPRPGQRTFLFRGERREIEQAIADYLNGGTVRARDFAAAQRQLKTALYGGNHSNAGAYRR